MSRHRVLQDRVLAAGAICWRTGPAGELELLMVHSTRWGDWSWPKGKLDPGETLPECAVREVTEETGVRPRLGVPLPSVSYVLPDGQDKTVYYWAAQVHESGLRTASDDEIADVAWLPVPAALERLTRPGDRPPLDELLARADRGRLDTRPLLVLRHAKARSRANWPGGEADRPLTSTGRRQAREVAGLLACWAPDRLLTSPWERCLKTLPPGAQPEVLPLLSEQGLHDDPDRIRATVADLLAGGPSALLCTHRPVLAVVVESLAIATDDTVRDRLPDGDPWLAPAEVLVAQIGQNSSVPGVADRVLSVERFRAETYRKHRY